MTKEEEAAAAKAAETKKATEAAAEKATRKAAVIADIFAKNPSKTVIFETEEGYFFWEKGNAEQHSRAQNLKTPPVAHLKK